MDPHFCCFSLIVVPFVAFSVIVGALLEWIVGGKESITLAFSASRIGTSLLHIQVFLSSLINFLLLCSRFLPFTITSV